MTRTALTAAAAAALLLVGQAAHAVTIDFQSLPSGPMASPIVYPQATFVSTTGQFYINGAGVSQDICPYTGGHCDAGVIVDFTHPVNNLSFTSVGDDAVSTVSVAITTTGGTFLFNGSTDGVFTSQDLQNLGAYSNITKLLITNDDPAGLAYDNFKFDVVGVPEPATWGLMIAGFGLAGSALRRRPVAA